MSHPDGALRATAVRHIYLIIIYWNLEWDPKSNLGPLLERCDMETKMDVGGDSLGLNQKKFQKLKLAVSQQCLVKSQFRGCLPLHFGGGSLRNWPQYCMSFQYPFNLR